MVADRDQPSPSYRQAKTLNVPLLQQLDAKDQALLTGSEKKFLADKKHKLKDLEKNLRKARAKRQKFRKEYDERCKTRDAEVLATNNEVVEKKENQIYFDGQTYTTRWSCLPA